MSPRRGGAQGIPRPAKWERGSPAPWSEGVDAILHLADVERAVAAHVPSEIVRGPVVERPEAGPRSAVLIALYDGDDGATTVLTRRAAHMRKHPGEVAFPGGAVDGDESDWAAAVREAHEEVGLDPDLPKLIGELDRFVTGASFSTVTPCVGRLDSKPLLVAAPDEVDEILRVSLTDLMSPGVYREELWTWEGRQRAMHFFNLEADTVWGATALMLYQLLILTVDT